MSFVNSEAGFDSLYWLYGPVAQLVDATGSNPVRCRFDSYLDYDGHAPLAELVYAAVLETVISGFDSQGGYRGLEFW